MLPSAEDFAGAMGALGLRSGSRLIVYDGSGVNLSAARAWWMFRTFGHRAVAVLDGGMARWTAEGRPVESGVPQPAPGDFSARLDPSRVLDLAAMRQALRDGTVQLVDVRSPGRFAGTEPEPRPGVRGGHIPGSRNLPYPDLVSEAGTVRPPDQLRAALARSGIDPRRPVVALCGSGTSACALLLALETLGMADARLYDGSWAEWGGREDTPVELGPPGALTPEDA